jgi:predicted ABC-type sugar transport system permease subunit
VTRADRGVVWIRRAIAIALIVVGGVWFFQGVGVIEGSFMTGEAVWAVIGAFCVVVGVVLLVRRPTRL